MLSVSHVKESEYVGKGEFAIIPSHGVVSVVYAKECRLGTYANRVPVIMPRRAIDLVGMPATIDTERYDGIIVTLDVVRAMSELYSILPENVSIFTVDDRHCRLTLHVPLHSHDTCAESGCTTCGERDCPANDPLHYHHDGCPSSCNNDAHRAP